jgi:hypothetical protein
MRQRQHQLSLSQSEPPVAAVHHGKAGKSKAKKESKEAIKVHQHEKESKGSKVHGPPFSMQKMMVGNWMDLMVK